MMIDKVYNKKIGNVSYLYVDQKNESKIPSPENVIDVKRVKIKP